MSGWSQELEPMNHDVGSTWVSPVEMSQNFTEDDYVIQPKVNSTYCKKLFNNLTQLYNEQFPDGFCPVVSDSVMCWPPTLINETATLRCFAELNGVTYDHTQNATRPCLFNGTWARSNYNSCVDIEPASQSGVETLSTIYFVGYILSLVSLSIAIGIFTYFKELRCLRNTIHMNLMWSFILNISLWVLTLFLVNYQTSIICIFVIFILNYCTITTFFWMFVEGLYLYILVVETLTRENLKLRVYACIGWGAPFIFVMIWAVVKSIIPVHESERNPDCPMFTKSSLDWIFQGPTVVVLLTNLVFLFRIMWVLITKLRSANTVETQQYHKAAKALLVLMPLLGITYVITMYYPTPDLRSKNMFECVRAVFLSTQGFTVALFYCFLNTEVQNTVHHHWNNWNTNRLLGSNRARSGSRSKDWSPRSRTESIRLYSQPSNIYHKRESCTSEVTTTTLVTVNGSSAKPTNGSAQSRSPFLHPPRPSYGGNV